MGLSVIVLSKNKLIGIDAVLPVLLEIRSRDPNTRFTFVFPHADHFELVRKNYHLWEGIQSLGPSTLVLQPGRRCATIAVLFRLALRIVFRRVCILKDADLFPQHRLFVRLLRMVASVVEIKTYLPALSLEAFRNIAIQAEFYAERKGRSYIPKPFPGHFDYLLSSLSADELHVYLQTEEPRVPVIKIGYPRSFPGWQKFVEAAVAKHPILQNGAYCLFILTTLDRISRVLDEPPIGQLLEETLHVLSRYRHEIRTVFRPHATTDIRKLQAILNRVGYTNYTIDFGHPMVLTSRAQFLISNSYSTTMFDAYCLGKPIVEYCYYDRELLRRMGGSYGGQCCDFFIDRDPAQLDRVLNDLIHSPRSMYRDPQFIAANFPKITSEFHQFWNAAVGNAPYHQSPR